MNYTLVSFELCPFVQRSVITLLEKEIPFTMTYLTLEELYHPPDWFTAISPFHKVPILRVGEVSLFESAVIVEYLDEVNPPSMHPADPLLKAWNRAWIVFAESVIGAHYGCFTAQDETAFEQSRQQLETRLAQLESTVKDGPYFNGTRFSLIDAAYGPVFQRITILEQRYRSDVLVKNSKVARWAQACLERESVIKSLPADFEKKFIDYIRDKGGYAAQLYGA